MITQIVRAWLLYHLGKRDETPFNSVMIVGPVFSRELITTPRRGRFYAYRAVYGGVLFLLICTAWLVFAGTQEIRNVGDMALFGSVLFRMLSPLQLLLMAFFSALLTASAVAQEKDRKTLVLLLLTRLNNSELVLGKLLASLLTVLVMLATALPIFLLLILLGGISPTQVLRVFAVTLATALVAGSLGSTIALWREKTFQTLAMTIMALVVWLLVFEPIHQGVFGDQLFGVSATTFATGLSPLRAVLAASQGFPVGGESFGGWGGGVGLFLLFSGSLVVLLNAVAIARVRVWNPSREIRRRSEADQTGESIWGAEHDLDHETKSSRPDGTLGSDDVESDTHAAAGPVGPTGPTKLADKVQPKSQSATHPFPQASSLEPQASAAEAAREGHVDSQLRSGVRAGESSREVWDNPILWREVCTWAYGRKIIAIRVIYVLLFAAAAVAMHFTVTAEAAQSGRGAVLPAAAGPLLPLLLVSLVMVNALAVTAITNERDGRALDLLLATDLSPKEFIFGKIGGVLWVTKEMIVLPFGLCIYLAVLGGISVENLTYLLIGLSVMIGFAVMLGLHCGMIYASSRRAITVSLGTVFFLFLGVVACVLMMVSFRGAFEVQLAPFLAFILGGWLGLYISLGIRNPSTAIAVASLCVPFATFYAIVSFLKEMPLAVFIVMSMAYGFTTAAMLVPAIFEFDVAMGRTSGTED